MSLKHLFIAIVLRGFVFVATLIGAAFLVQVLLWAAPGDPIDLIPNSADIRAELEVAWGLDKPIHERFFHSLIQVWSGPSLSVQPGARVGELIKPALWRSGKLLFVALFLCTSSAILLAKSPYKYVKIATRLVSVTPVFLLAYVMVMTINAGTYSLIQADVITRPNWFALPLQDSLPKSLLAVFILASASGALAHLQSTIQNDIQRIKHSPFVEAARSRGLPVSPHVWKNLLLPLTILTTNQFAFAIGGLIVLEKVLLLNGAGSLMWDACLSRDYPVAMALSMSAALIICMARFIGDAIRVIVDPRLRGSP